MTEKLNATRYRVVGVPVRRAVVLATLLAAIVASDAAVSAQQDAAIPRSAVSFTGQPRIVFPQGKDYVVAGYRAAKFGMTKDQVRAAIAQDFGATPVTEKANPIEGTTALVVDVDALAPGNGPARVTYVFGKSLGRLITINTVWRTAADADTAARANLVDAAAKAASEFLSYQWKLFTTARGIPVGPNALIVFAGGDEAGGGVEVRLQGIQYSWVAAGGEKGMGPMPSGPAVLRIAYTASVTTPDISRLLPGSF
jgi:hypothetical protein